MRVEPSSIQISVVPTALGESWEDTPVSTPRVAKTAEHTQSGGKSGAGGSGSDVTAEQAELDGCCGVGGVAGNMAEDALRGGRGIAGARIGDDYQAVIPDLMYHVGNSEFNSSPFARSSHRVKLARSLEAA